MRQEIKQAYVVLSLEHNASEKEVRRAYARLAKATRPDTDPKGFTRIRDAYEQVLAHVQSAKLPDTPESSFTHTPIQKANLAATTSESGLSTVLDTAPSFDEQQAKSQNRFENLSGRSYAEADDSVVNLDDELADEQTSNESALNENEPNSDDNYQNPQTVSAAEQTTEQTTELTTELTTEQTNRSSNEQFVEYNGISNTEFIDENITKPQSFVKIQQLLDRCYSLLNLQQTYNAQIEQELISITNEIDYLTTDLEIGTRDQALEQLAIQIFDHDSAPFGFVEKVATHLELVNTVLPITAPLAKRGLQARYYDMLNVNDFEKRSYGEDKFITYFIHGEPRPFTFFGFPSKKVEKLYANYSDMLLSSWPPRPDLIHINAQFIINQSKVDDVEKKEVTEPIFDESEKRQFLKLVWIIGWIGFAIYLYSSRTAPSTHSIPDKMLDKILNPSEEVQRRVDATRKQRELETGD